MKNTKLKEAFAETRALLQQGAPAGEAPGHLSWLMGALTSLDNAEMFYEHYEDAVAQAKEMALHQQNIAKIQQESAEEVKRHNADLAARTAQRAQEQTRSSQRDRT